MPSLLHYYALLSPLFRYGAAYDVIDAARRHLPAADISDYATRLPLFIDAATIQDACRRRCC